MQYSTMKIGSKPVLQKMKPEYVQMIKSIVYDVEIHSNEILIDQGHQIWQIIQKHMGGKGFIDFVKVLIENCSSVKMIES